MPQVAHRDVEWLNTETVEMHAKQTLAICCSNNRDIKTTQDTTALQHTKANKLRILLISPIPPPNGGIARWTVLLREWAARDTTLIIHVLDIAPRWRSVGSRSIMLRIIGGSIQGLRDIGGLFVRLMGFKPHVVHVNTSCEFRVPWDTVVIALCTLAGIKTVYHIRMGRLPEIARRKSWEWWGMRGALTMASRIIVLDKESEIVLGKELKHLSIFRIPNAVPFIPEVTGLRVAEKQTVLYLGYIIPKKGMRELMEVWRDLNPGDWRLRLGGAGSEAYKAELLRTVGSNVDVQFLGDLVPEDAWQEMINAEVFVLPTYTEGFPNVILEAMAARKAIVATRVGAIPDMLAADGPEPCGLVVQPCSVEALGSALNTMMSDSNLRRILGARARKRVLQQYMTDSVFARLVNLWCETAKST